jgi:hypothetical protein
MSDKNNFLDTNDPLKTLLRESAMEQAPKTLVSNVMKAIDAKTSTPDTGKPLISILGWVLIGTGLAILSLVSFLLGEGGEGSEYLAPLTRWIGHLRVPSGSFGRFPDTVWLGVLAFGVYGLLQLFWMKRQLDQQRLF